VFWIAPSLAKRWGQLDEEKLACIEELLGIAEDPGGLMNRVPVAVIVVQITIRSLYRIIVRGFWRSRQQIYRIYSFIISRLTAVHPQGICSLQKGKDY